MQQNEQQQLQHFLWAGYDGTTWGVWEGEPGASVLVATCKDREEAEAKREELERDGLFYRVKVDGIPWTKLVHLPSFTTDVTDRVKSAMIAIAEKAGQKNFGGEITPMNSASEKAAILDGEGHTVVRKVPMHDQPTELLPSDHPHATGFLRITEIGDTHFFVDVRGTVQVTLNGTLQQEAIVVLSVKKELADLENVQDLIAARNATKP